MKISHRLYLTLLPVVVGTFLMIGMAYYGQYARTAPNLVLVVGALAVVGSAALTWSNARFVAGRIARLAGGPATSSTSARPMVSSAADELDQIASVVDRLSSAVEVAEHDRVARERAVEERDRDYAQLLASLADASTKRLEEIRLPLHILLENRFGELNENQEEMLGAARTAAEAADADMRSLRQIAELDMGIRPLRHDRMRPAAVIDAIRPLLLAAAEAAGVTVELDVEPLLPEIVGDRPRLQEALVTLLRGPIETAAANRRARVHVRRELDVLHLDVQEGGPTPFSVAWAEAVRVVQAHGGKVERQPDGVRVAIPIPRR